MSTLLTRLIAGAAYGTAAAALLVCALTIVGEEYAPLKNGLKGMFTHHWLGKSALSIVAFVIVGFVFSLMPNVRTVRAVWVAFFASVLAALLMAAYFLLHTLHVV